MSVFHDEVEIEDFEYDEETETYSYPCPCGDRFLITREDLENGEDVATCPSCSLIVRVIYDQMEEYGGASDDTALNGIRLFCIKINSTSSAVYTVESDSGKFGQWSGITWCPTGFLTAFQLKVEVPQGILDDTAANNIKFRCTSGAIIEGTGGSFGDYGGWSNACTRGGICGIETKQDPYHNAFVDDTALNDVRFFCCD
ncbi:hypothetical protein KIL84_010898 [Mauremys mutica]|uniref:DPH-type MB domain-containing protein n=1 Tax=Mauremys mutica TaxID=74926 RepID=A0A9D4B1U0_9SAUR|nr:hypothetical protein KIL84_010898 [Mauremys mutica]